MFTKTPLKPIVVYGKISPSESTYHVSWKSYASRHHGPAGVYGFGYVPLRSVNRDTLDIYIFKPKDIRVQNVGCFRHKR